MFLKLLNLFLILLVSISIIVACSKNSDTAAYSTVSNSKAVAGSTIGSPGLLAEAKANPTNIEFGKYGGVAYQQEVDGLFRVGHNGVYGSVYKAISHITISPDGRRCAYYGLKDDIWRLMVDGREVKRVDLPEQLLFSPDSLHIASKSKIEGHWALLVDNAIIHLSSIQFNRMNFSADSNKIVFVDGDDEEDKSKMRLIVCNTGGGNQFILPGTGALLVASENKTRIACLQYVNNKQRVVSFAFAKPEKITESALYDAIEVAIVSDDGNSVSFVGSRAGKRYIVLNGREEPFIDGSFAGPFSFTPDNKSVSMVLEDGVNYFIHQAFNNKPFKVGKYDQVSEVVYSSDGKQFGHLAQKKLPASNDRSVFAVINGKASPRFDMLISLKFSPDGQFVVCRARQDGKRFVVVMDSAAKIISQHKSYDMVFPFSFLPDGKSIAYGVQDGNKLLWKVEKL